MGTQVITRRDVTHYVVTKLSFNKDDEKDSAKLQFKKLPEAREFARNLYRLGNLKSLTNSNGVVLPI